MEKEGQYCDPVTGEYTAADLRNGSMDEPILSDLEIIYVGDPMCSWCWGISNHLKELKNHFSDYKFSIVQENWGTRGTKRRNLLNKLLKCNAARIPTYRDVPRKY